LPGNLFWSSQTLALFESWKSSADDAGTLTEETLKGAVPVELIQYVERLFLRRIPRYDGKEAQKALEDCVKMLKQEHLRQEKQAIGSLLAEREAEVGALTLAEAGSGEEINDERVLELVMLQAQDVRTGLRLHGKEVNDEVSATETRRDG
jgi:hypothetical protein